MGKNELYACGCAALLGLLAGGVADHYIEKPDSVYVRDLNGDKRDDLIITSKGMKKANVFMQQEDGTYIPLDKFEKNLKEKEKGKIKSIEEQVKSIEKSAESEAYPEPKK